MTDTPSPSPGGRRRRFTVDALFADTRPQAAGVTDLASAKEIRLTRIVPDPSQPRRTFDPDRLSELAASIAREGVLQPIVVRYDEEADRYVVVHGERRWRASTEAGLETIPAIVREVPAERRLIHQLMENIVRDDLNAVDRAAALRALKAQLGDVPWETVAETVGIGRSRLFQLLGTAKLPPAVQDDIRAGRLSEKQSRALQGLPPAAQAALRDAIVDADLPAEDAAAFARALRAAPLDPDDLDGARVALEALRAEAAAHAAEAARPGVPPPAEAEDARAALFPDPTPPADPGPRESDEPGGRPGKARGRGTAGTKGGGMSVDAAPAMAARPDGVDPTGHALLAHDPALALLLPLAEAAVGGEAALAPVREAAVAAGAPPYDPDRLLAEIRALARGLARTPTGALAAGTLSYAALVALRDALTALLEASGSDPSPS